MISSNALLAALVEEWLLALVALESFQAAQKADAVSFNSALAACEESSQWRCALQLMGPMGRREQISEACAMSACAKAQRWQKVLQLAGNQNVLAWNAYVGCQPWQMVLPSLEAMRRRSQMS